MNESLKEALKEAIAVFGPWLILAIFWFFTRPPRKKNIVKEVEKNRQKYDIERNLR